MDIGNLTGYLELDGSEFDKGLKEAEGGLKGFSKTGAVIAAAAGVAIVAALTAAVVSGMDTEAGNDKLAAQLGLTEAQAEQAGKTAGSLYADAYGGSLNEVNDAVGAVMSSIDGMRTASSDAVEDMTAKTLNLADAYGIDVGRAAQVAGQMIRNGIAVDGVHAMDLLTASLQRVPAAVREDLVDAVDEYGPFMESIGIKGEEAMGLLAAASADGAYGIDKTGDALKEFTIRATDMSATSGEAFDTLGLSQEDMTNKLLAGGDTAAGAFDQIITGLQGIEDPAAQSQAALALFGTPLEDLSVSEIPKFLGSLASAEDSLGNVAGAAEKFDATLNENASASLTSLRRQLELAVVSLANNLLPAVTTASAFLASNFGPALAGIASVLTGSVIPALVALSGFIADNQTVFTIVAGIITAVFLPALVAMGLGALASAAQVAAAWVITQVASVKALAIHSASVAAKVAGWALMGAQSLIHAAKVAAAWLIAIGPIGLVIAAVVGLVVLVIKNWDTIRNATVAVWNAVAGAVSAAASSVSSFVSGMVSSVLGFIARLSALPGEAARHFGGMVSAALIKGGELVAYVGGIPGRILSALGNLGNILYSAGRDILAGMVRGITSKVGDAVSAVKGAVGSVVSGAKGFLGISSPSKVFAEIGQQTGQGLIVGLHKMGPAMSAAMADAVTLPAPQQLRGLNVPSYTRGDPTYGGAVQRPPAVFQIESVNVGPGRTFAEEMALTEALYGGMLR